MIIHVVVALLSIFRIRRWDSIQTVIAVVSPIAIVPAPAVPHGGHIKIRWRTTGEPCAAW